MATRKLTRVNHLAMLNRQDATVLGLADMEATLTSLEAVLWDISQRAPSDQAKEAIRLAQSGIDMMREGIAAARIALRRADTN